jgi:hypothetical protein
MSRLAAALILSLALAGCATATRDEGVATLDALSDAQAKCAATGGDLKLKVEGDPTQLDAYECVRKK